jgi:2-dehydro-3-deoxyphosphogluconate aldolase/(4S)-4-hydroxy-2-oxoglutarate aldolase
MAVADRLTVLQAIVDVGVIPVFYNGDVETAYQVAMACHKGGAHVIEFTNRGDFAVEVFREVHRRLLKDAPGVLLGVGSIVDAPTAALYINYGAAFVVGPLLNPEVARLCNRRKIAYSPGCGSASEISQAEELGVEIVKVFPGASVGGADFVKSVLGPCPWTRIMVTGGVDPSEQSLKSWFGAGATAVGMGSNLIRADLVKAGKFDEISETIRQTLQLVKQIRG